MTPADLPWGELGLLGACMMAFTMLIRGGGALPLRARARRGFPVVLGLYFAGLGIGRMLAVPGFVAAQGWAEYGMAAGGLACWAFGLAALLRGT